MSDLSDYLETRLPPLLQVLRGSDVSEIELQESDARVRLHRSQVVVESESEATASITDEAPSDTSPDVRDVTSPLVGTFYRAGQPSMAPLVAEGSRVEGDTVVGIIEALQVLTEVSAGLRGTVIEVMATDGQAVEYGQRLFVVRVDA